MVFAKQSGMSIIASKTANREAAHCVLISGMDYHDSLHRMQCAMKVEDSFTDDAACNSRLAYGNASQ
jgi:hypothetical protein